VGARFFAPVQTGPGAHPAFCTVSTGVFPGVKSGRGVTLTPQPLLVPWSRKGGAVPLLPLSTVWPVQSLSACTSCTFPFFKVVRALNGAPRHEGMQGIAGTFPHIINIGNRWSQVVSFTPQPLYPRGIVFRYLFSRKQGGTQRRS
jgi:hypothetical protein